MTYKFYDTSSLLLQPNLTEENTQVLISSITLKELENIKNSNHKDYSVKAQARKAIHLLNENYICIIYREKMSKPLRDLDIEINDDAKILSAAFFAYKELKSKDFFFYTNDLSLKQIANLLFPKEQVKSVSEEEDLYTGFKDLYFTEQQLSDFYSSLLDGEYNKKLNLLTNEYLNILDKDNKIIDSYCWTGEYFRSLKYANIDSTYLGKIKPIKGDIYQALAIDSLLNNQITMLKGLPGSGKSWLSMGYLFYCLEKNKINKIIIFCNPVATKNSAKLGFYPGDRNQKLLDSQIGNFLISKLGGKLIVEQLIEQEKLMLLPFSDIRGFDTTGMNAGIYITEAQNLDVSLLKLALQRIGEDSICIVEGDEKTQVDLIDYEGFNNGMKRMSKVFRGHNIYGEVTLQKIHRSRIAQIADEL